jgi:hypothetical protein
MIPLLATRVVRIPVTQTARRKTKPLLVVLVLVKGPVVVPAGHLQVVQGIPKVP